MIQLHTITSEEKKQNFDITELFEMQKNWINELDIKEMTKWICCFVHY